MSEIIKSIAAIMGEVGSVTKAGKNEFHRYAYATAADILHKLQPLMAREGLVVFQTEKERNLSDDGVLSVTYDFTIAHKSGEVWPTPITRTGMSSAKNSKGGFDDKCLNKCHTSAHKYFHLTLFEIPTGDYDDADGEEDRPPVARNGSQARAPQRQQPTRALANVPHAVDEQPAGNPFDDGDDSEARDAFFAACKGIIANTNRSYEEVVIWWNAEDQKKQRRDFALSHDQIDELKGMITARRPVQKEAAE